MKISFDIKDERNHTVDEVHKELDLLPRIGDTLSLYHDGGVQTYTVNNIHWKIYPEKVEPKAHIELVHGSLSPAVPSKAERLILHNQYVILEALHKLASALPDDDQRRLIIFDGDGESYKFSADAIQQGNSLLMSEVFDHIYDGRLSEEEQSEILNVLDMYTAIQRGYDALGDKGDLDAASIEFPGWDGHRDELSFARLFCYRGLSELDHPPIRFQFVRPGPAIDSHFPTTDMYRRMLDVFKPIFENIIAQHRTMTLDEIKAVLAAQVHPEHAARNN